MRTGGFILLIAAVLVAPAAGAQDVSAGKEIAQTWCASCHNVDAKEKPTARDAAPSFLSIAQMKSTTEMSLAAFLASPHGGMPNLTLSRKEIRDVSAYILSLHTQP